MEENAHGVRLAAGIAYEDLPPVLDVAEAAEVLGAGERAVRDAIRRGELGHVRLGRLIRIPRHRLIEFLDGSTRRRSRRAGQQGQPTPRPSQADDV